ncbi:carboxylesterase/lipase family protein [Hominifimenecus sp. rT4P-3]|uniref:carboxylesterase/lipase family protein n=1 Tax=Hominifimenecus sp. rT4P-3 TaxID=3242979 RepID=UPI003DA32FEB
MALTRVKTESGILKGALAGNQRVAVYKGVPYAAPPVGAYRWREPQPVEPWEGERTAYVWGDACLQKRVLGGGDFYQKEFYADRTFSEDCLTANIWTPAKEAGEGLPVAVWIHGGGMQHGDCINMAYDGEAFAKRGVIFVTFGYRLNVFGFLAHPELTAERKDADGVASSGNYAYLDILAALGWVQKNIAAFGGDPKRVTIMGQSGGAGAVMDVATMELSRGLYCRGIMQSGGGLGGMIGDNKVTLAEAEQIGKEFFAYIGAENLEQARQIPGQKMVEHYYDFCRQRPKKEGDPYSPFNMNIDGYVFHDTSVNRIKANQFGDVDYLVGAMADEFRYVMPRRQIDLAKYRADIQSKYGRYAKQYLKAAHAETAEGAEETEQSSSSDTMWASAQAFAEILLELGRKPAYLYYFSKPAPGEDHRGAFHSGEHAYVFQTFLRINRPYDGSDFDLSNEMCAYWTNFIKNGDPNGEGLMSWKPYTKQESLAKEFGGDGRMRPMPETEMSAFRRDYILGRLKEDGNE